MFVRVCTCVDVCGTDDVVQFNICVYVYSICMYAGMYVYVCMYVCVYIYIHVLHKFQDVFLFELL